MEEETGEEMRGEERKQDEDSWGKETEDEVRRKERRGE